MAKSSCNEQGGACGCDADSMDEGLWVNSSQEENTSQTANDTWCHNTTINNNNFGKTTGTFLEIGPTHLRLRDTEKTYITQSPILGCRFWNTTLKLLNLRNHWRTSITHCSNNLQEHVNDILSCPAVKTRREAIEKGGVAKYQPNVYSFHASSAFHDEATQHEYVTHYVGILEQPSSATCQDLSCSGSVWQLLLYVGEERSTANKPRRPRHETLSQQNHTEILNSVWAFLLYDTCPQEWMNKILVQLTEDPHCNAMQKGQDVSDLIVSHFPSSRRNPTSETRHKQEVR